MENPVLKMTHICLIQQIEEKIDAQPSSFKYLNKMDIENLELLRDELITEYNLITKGN